MIQTVVCFRCKSRYTCIGSTKRAYTQSYKFLQRGSYWRPICSEEKECLARMKSGDRIVIVWNKQGTKLESSANDEK